MGRDGCICQIGIQIILFESREKIEKEAILGLIQLVLALSFLIYFDKIL